MTAAYILAADAILLVHALFAFSLVAGLVLVLVGRGRPWSWIRNPWLRIAHLAGVVVVAVQAWVGVVCPLTTWEMALRARGGDAVYAGSFISYWLQALLYYEVPPWVFVVCYTAFALLVAASWWLVPPRIGRGGAGN